MSVGAAVTAGLTLLSGAINGMTKGSQGGSSVDTQQIANNVSTGVNQEIKNANFTPDFVKNAKYTPNVQPKTAEAPKESFSDKFNKFKAGAKEVGDRVNTYANTAANVMGAASNMAPNNNMGTVQAPTIASDERLKEDLKKEDPIDCFAQIDAYLYKYTPEAQAMYGKDGTVNNDQNFGVMAQDLAQNPITAAAVEKDENGYLMLDGGRLSSINTAMISELCKKVQELENIIYGR